MSVGSISSNSLNTYYSFLQKNSYKMNDNNGNKESGTETNGTENVSSAGKAEITAEQIKEITKLQSRDTEVRTHEQAHMSSGGQYTKGGASYTYDKGPDGKMYATGGEVSIDISAEEDPEKTIQKMQVVKKAALAPTNPSTQDRQVASKAAQQETKAQKELTEEAVGNDLTARSAESSSNNDKKSGLQGKANSEDSKKEKSSIKVSNMDSAGVGVLKETMQIFSDFNKERINS